MRIITSNSLPSLHQVASPLSIGLLSSSPIGPLWVATSELGMLALDWEKSQAEFTLQIKKQFQTDVRYNETNTAGPIHQISEYLAGVRRHFDLTLDLTSLSPFQLQVLQLTLEIPYGKTSTYQEIAARMGKPKVARAVGRAEATNPIPLIIPCHRVIGSDGSLHGYGGPGGIKLKTWLLNLEQS